MNRITQGPPESTQLGYTDHPPFDGGVIAPINFRPPEPRELQKIIDPAAEYRLELLDLPLELGRRVLEGYDPCDTDNLYPKVKPVELTDGFVGSLVGSREDPPRVDASSIFSLEDKRSVGPHQDMWEDSEVEFVVANMGPGLRYHGFSPYLTTKQMGGRGAACRTAFMEHALRQNTIMPDDPAMVWVPLQPPQNGRMSAMSSLVCKTLHDGSTHKVDEPSRVLLLARA